MADSAAGGAASVIEPGTVNAPEFPSDLEWLNTEAPLALRQLRGKIVLLDFWTHCCINCLHALEDLKRLERKYASELVVIGVHSAKFDAEKSTESIRQAVLRYGIEHPVVNDREMRVWQEYVVRAWPSFVLVDPRGKVFGAHSGERVFELFDRVISQMIEHYDRLGELRRGPVQARPEADLAPPSVLAFPGKVLADERGRRLFIADTNHHRIVVASLDDGAVREVLGSGAAGFADGGAREARFRQPQGMSLVGDTLYVADTGNHAIRAADLAAGTVSTVVGDGQQDLEWDSAPGPLDGRRLNSPWDIEFAHGVLFVAMAGSHQIFGIDIDGAYIAGHAGSGREDHVDGPLMAAALAQPSGLTSDGGSLFVADSEISSIRAVSLDPRGGHVRTVVGKGLFDFGDVDGRGGAVRMQHPMGVAHAGGVLYVADTFNNKLKAIELRALSTRTLAGSGAAGYRDGPGDTARFDGPAGVSYAAGSLYVADTNNHAIRKVDVSTGVVSTWTIRDMARLAPPVRRARLLPERAVRPGTVRVVVQVALPSGHAVAPGGASQASLRVGGSSYRAALADGVAEMDVEVASDGRLDVETTAYYCHAERAGTCLYHGDAVSFPLRLDERGASRLVLRSDAGPAASGNG